MDPNNIQNDDDDFEPELRGFYLQHLPSLRNVPLHLIPHHVFRDIAVMIHSKLLFESEWRDYVFPMVENNFTLDKIEASAKVSRELPVYVALNSTLLVHPSFGSVIFVLLQKSRLDVLQHLRPFVTEFLEKKSTTNIKRVISTEEQSSDSSTNNLNYTSETISNFNSLTICPEDSESNNEIHVISTVENVHCEFNTLQQNSASIDCTPAMQIQKSSLREELSSDAVKNLPSAPPEESLIVLIQHTEFENSVAERLSSMLRKEGIIVKLYADIDYLVMMDSLGALTAVLREVDFIVPIVSEKFLEEVHPRVDVKYLESSYAMNNRNLYELIMNEYRFDRCVNFRVRPVLVPDMNRRLLKNDLILCQALRLWSEVPKLVDVLKKTKELIPKYPFHQ